MNKALATDLAALIQVAYAQYAGTSAPLPEGLQPLVIEETLTVHENGRQVPMGFVASHRAPATGELVAFVVIRGTTTLLEWLDDGFIVPAALIGFGNTTDGFEFLARQLEPQIIKTLQRLGIAKVIVTGHSLGAALAQLAVIDIWNNLQIVAESYTFCGPRCGDPAFAQAFVAKFICWRIFNCEDLVPTLPPAASDLTGKIEAPTDWLWSLFNHSKGLFEHAGEPVALTFNKGSLEANHDLANVVEAMQSL